MTEQEKLKIYGAFLKGETTEMRREIDWLEIYGPSKYVLAGLEDHAKAIIKIINSLKNHENSKTAN